MYLINEMGMRSIPKNVKHGKDKIRMECIIQTCGDINRNKRRYSLDVMKEGINQVMPRVKQGGFMGELDHPISDSPARQVTVWYKECSHRFLDIGLDGNKVVAVVETVRTPNGYILKNLAEDGIPVGFSFRGMGEVKQMNENGKQFQDVVLPISVICWDSVSNPSHEVARLLKITENVHHKLQNDARQNLLSENATVIYEDSDMICTKEGFCYIPNDFDKLVEQRFLTINNKFKI